MQLIHSGQTMALFVVMDIAQAVATRKKPYTRTAVHAFMFTKLRK